MLIDCMDEILQRQGEGSLPNQIPLKFCADSFIEHI